MTLEYLIFANIILIPRLGYLAHESARNMRVEALVTLLQLLLILCVFELNAAGLTAQLVILLCLSYALVTEGKEQAIKNYGLTGIVALLVIPGYVASYGRGFEITGISAEVVLHLIERIPFLSGVTLDSFYSITFVTFALMVLANETNIGIREIIHLLALEPRKKKDKRKNTEERTIDKKEYNAGRVIGILERWLMFIVIISSPNLNALAFIIAAKGLARMKQLKNKEFAEYMLIGTFLSAMSALMVGFWTKSLLT